MARNTVASIYKEPPPNYSYPVVIGPCRLRSRYGAMPWAEVLAAGRSGRDGLRVVTGFQALGDTRLDECAWREISTITWGKVTGLLYQNTGEAPAL
jgi:hypothetical protein